MNTNTRFAKHSKAILAAATLSVLPAMVNAGVSTNTAGPVRQGSSTPGDNNTNYSAITISLSGQTALRSFTNSLGFSTLPRNTSITFNYGPNGTIPATFFAPDLSGTNVQLARRNFTLGDTPGGVNATGFGDAPASQNHSALRIEWHEQGSTDGLIDLINDQVGYTTGPGGTGILSTVASRGASTSNPTWVNGNQFTGGNTLGGHFLAAGNFADTYNISVYDLATGRNLQGGQNRVQFAVGEFKTESFQQPGASAFTNLPGSPGYGRGNVALNPATTSATGLGSAGVRQQLRATTIINQSTDKVNPETGSNYVAGPWNSAGVDNIDSKQIAVTAVPFVANPGTGLRRINKGDAQWLQTLGRLQNGADFNVVLRTVDAGQRIVPALNTGVDPTWGVGENDDGNTSGTAAAEAQKTLGANFRFSGKTSGTAARDAIAQSRLGFGPLSITEARGASSLAPVRTLDVAFNNLTDPNTAGGTDYSAFTRLSLDTLVSGEFKSTLISHYNTIKAPNVTKLNQFRSAFAAANGGTQPTPQQELNWWKTQTSDDVGIKGDPNGNVKTFINNIASSIGTVSAGTFTTNDATNPGDALFAAGFLSPQLLKFTREFDGGPITPRSISPQAQAVLNSVSTNFGNLFSPLASPGSPLQTSGPGGATPSYYSALNSSAINPATGQPFVTNIAINGGTATLLITEKNADGTAAANGTFGPKGNYLFGNFNQDGKRDYAAVKEAVNAAISLAKIDQAKSSIYLSDGGVSNATVVPSVSGSPQWAAQGSGTTTLQAGTKGDLIILGDFNTDGRFDGRDVYLLARGAALSDDPSAPAASATGLTTASGPNFADQVRNPNAKLNKNGALDHALTQTVPNGGDASDLAAAKAFIRTTARAELTGTHAPITATILADLGGGVKTYTNDPTGTNAFNKSDVNRDGTIDIQDARIVDFFHTKSYKILADQLNAVVRTDSNDGGTAFANGLTALDPADTANASISRRQISLVDVKLVDDNSAVNINDFAVIRNALGNTKLKGGDADFSGSVDTVDFNILLANFGGAAGPRWSQGNFDLNNVISSGDFNLLVANFGQSSVPGSLPGVLPGSVVPEPGSVMAVLSASLLLRRRRP